MNVGKILIILGFALAVYSAISFISAQRKIYSKVINHRRLAPIIFNILTFISVLASAVLLYHLLTHNYKYEYVYKYSSNTQPLIYLISAFWAGQEGTFLLWALLVNIMGSVFIHHSRTKDNYALAIVSIFQAFLFLIMIIKSPFASLANTPIDGQGMNPLLMDPWMAVHPPLLFIGYASAVFPFALAISALIRRDYSTWQCVGFRWTLFSVLSLGAGIIIGGFWAYEVLGWGGYWGWDPVENSSLVPWLTMIALIHGFIVQKSRGSLVRTNLFLALISFILVLYSTFLTRSGVLSDFSVHSFVDLGINNYLVAMMIASIAGGIGIFAIRFTELKSEKIDFSSFNKEVALVLSIYVLCLIAFFTLIGTSSPIITGLLDKASQVDISFYNKVNFPFAIIMALLLGITPFLFWREGKISESLKLLLIPLLFTALACIIAYVSGVKSTKLMIFAGASAFGLISNIMIAFKQYKLGWLKIGGPITHIGVGLLLIGIIGSGSFDDKTTFTLKLDEPKDIFEFNFTFKGILPAESKKDKILIEMSNGESSFQVTPKLYFSEYTRSVMREPDIVIFPLYDLYISPIELKSSVADNQHPTMELSKGETKEFEGYQIQFVKFDVGQHANSGFGSVGAVLKVTANGKTHEIIPSMMFDMQGNKRSIPVSLPAIKQHPSKGIEPHITLNAINAEQKIILLEFHGFDDEYLLTLEVSKKPLMLILWIGVVLILIGIAIAWWRHLSPN